MALSHKAKRPAKDVLIKAAKPLKTAMKPPVKAAAAAAKPALAAVKPGKKALPAKTPVAVKPPSAAKPPPQQIAQAKAALQRANTGLRTAPEKKPTAVAAASRPAPTKPRNRKISVDANPQEAAGALAQKWAGLYKKAEQIDAKPYNMKAIFEEKTAIVHKVLGWGYILANRNDRLEVLFKDGIKYLISNYKP